MLGNFTSNTLSPTKEFFDSHLNRALKLRLNIYPIINDYLSPQNFTSEAQALQKQINTSKVNSNNASEELFLNKNLKAKILGKFIEEILTNPKDFNLQLDIAPTANDKELCKILLIHDLVYYGPITILFLCKILRHYENLDHNPLFLLLQHSSDYERVTEIRINDYKTIYYEAVNKIFTWSIPFISDQQLINIIERMISENNLINNSCITINTASPIVDFEHPCAYIRGAAVIPPVSEHPFLTLRIHPSEAFTLKDLVNFGMLNQQMQKFLIACQKAGTTIAIAGTMGSGKTTLLSALSEHWPIEGRKATIEDTPELKPLISDLIKMRTIEYDRNELRNIDVTRLAKACKRHSVRYVVLSEARDGSAWEILQLSQAILGCLMTFHYTLRSDKFLVDQALNTLAALCKQNYLSPKGEDLKYLIASIVQILILVEQSPDDNLRRISKIYYITGYDELNGGHFKYVELFSFNKTSGFTLNSISKEFETYLQQRGVDYHFES
jgi:Flp pilus assembly CpaF family ATPase